MIAFSQKHLGGFISKSELEVPHPEGICAEKIICFCPGSVELRMRENGILFAPVKYTPVYCAPHVFRVSQHYHVS